MYSPRHRMDLQVLGCGPPLSQGLWLPGHEDKGNRANSTGEDDGNDSWDQLQRGRSTLILVNQGQLSLGGEARNFQGRYLSFYSLGYRICMERHSRNPGACWTGSCRGRKEAKPVISPRQRDIPQGEGAVSVSPQQGQRRRSSDVKGSQPSISH